MVDAAHAGVHNMPICFQTCLNKYLGRILLIYNCVQRERSVSDKGKKGGVYEQ